MTYWMISDEDAKALRRLLLQAQSRGSDAYREKVTRAIALIDAKFVRMDEKPEA